MSSELHKLIASTTYVWSWPWLAPRQQLYAYIIHAARARMLLHAALRAATAPPLLLASRYCYPLVLLLLPLHGYWCFQPATAPASCCQALAAATHRCLCGYSYYCCWLRPQAPRPHVRAVAMALCLCVWPCGGQPISLF